MSVSNKTRSLWLLLLSIAIIGLLFAGATVAVSGKNTDASDAVPAPILYDIDNADRDGTYVVEWSAVADIDEYILREAVNDVPPNDLKVYQGTETSYSRTNMTDGQYCYRVRAIILGGEWGPWSEHECTTVGDPPPEPTSTNTPTATATQKPPSATPTNTNTPAPTSSSTPAPSPTKTPRPIVNLPIIVYQLPPTATPTPTIPPTPTNTPIPTNTPVPTNTPSPTPTPVPLFVGLTARWDGRGFLYIDEYYEPGTHKTMEFTEMVDNDTIKAESHLWYDPNPIGWESGEWDSFYSVSTGDYKSSSVPGDPSWKWGYYTILPYRFNFEDGETIDIYGQDFRVSGPHNGTGAFGQRITYWHLVNRNRFLFRDNGDLRQYVNAGDATLEYDINTRLLLSSDVLRHLYFEGEETPYTVQYIDYLTSSNAYPVQQLRMAPVSSRRSTVYQPPSTLLDIPEESLLPGPYSSK